MAKKSGIGSLGILLSLIGGVIIFVFGILMVVSYLVKDLQATINDLRFETISFGNESLLIFGILLVVLGGVVVWAWKNKKVEEGGDLLLWGIVFLVIGILTSSIPGFLLILGGVLMIVDYFI